MKDINITPKTEFHDIWLNTKKIILVTNSGATFIFDRIDFKEHLLLLLKRLFHLLEEELKCAEE